MALLLLHVFTGSLVLFIPAELCAAYGALKSIIVQHSV
jgi:hypothetical protein